MRILVAVPCGDMLDVNFVDSITKLLQHPCDYNIDVRYGAGSLIYDARNGLSQMAVTGGYDYILWLDSDMSFEPDLLDRLLEDMTEERDVVCGMFFSRRYPFKPTVYEKCRVSEKEDGSINIEVENYKPIPKGIFEIEACGFAAVLMKTEPLKEIFEKGGLPFSPMLGLGEDLSACLRFRELGHKLYCDSTITVGHTAHIIVGGDDYRISWNDAQ